MHPARTCGACGGTAGVAMMTVRLGITCNAHYRCDDCGHAFTVMTGEGKAFAWLLGVPLAGGAFVGLAVQPSRNSGENVALVVLVALLAVALGSGVATQLRAERNNPPR